MHLTVRGQLVIKPALRRVRGQRKTQDRSDPARRRAASRSSCGLRYCPITLALLAAMRVLTAEAHANSTFDEVRRIGLPPLYEALVAVANCPDLTINTRYFAAVAAQYHLTPSDLTPYGRFGREVTDLAADYKTRILDDRIAFCSSARLSFSVVHGILKPATRY